MRRAYKRCAPTKGSQKVTRRVAARAIARRTFWEEEEPPRKPRLLPIGKRRASKGERKNRAPENRSRAQRREIFGKRRSRRQAAARVAIGCPRANGGVRRRAQREKTRCRAACISGEQRVVSKNRKTLFCQHKTKSSSEYGCGNNLTSRGVIPKYFRRRRA